MKKVFLSLSIILSVFLSISCNNILQPNFKGIPNKNAYVPGAEIGMDKVDENIQEALRKYGVVNKVYVNEPKARYFNGQIIDNFLDSGLSVRFDTFLVEFDLVNEDVANYVKKVFSNKEIESDSVLYQMYDGVKYDDSKIYVEFVSYTVVQTNELYCLETRLFSSEYLQKVLEGNYMEDEDKNNCFAKTTMYSPDFTIDILRHKNIITGEDAIYEYKNYKTFDIQDKFSDKKFFDTLGTIDHIYKNNYLSNPDLNTEIYLIDYSDMPNYEKTIKPYVKYKNNEAESFQSYDIERQKGHVYVEVKKNSFDSDNYNWRLSFENKDKVYCTYLDNKSLSVLANSSLKDISGLKEQITTYMKNIGELSNVYETNESILLDKDYKTWKTSFLFEYNNDVKKENTSTSITKSVACYTAPINNDKTYLEVTIKGEKDNISSFSVLKKNKNNNSWTPILEDSSFADFVSFTGYKNTVTTEDVSLSFSDKLFFEEFGTIAHIYKNTTPISSEEEEVYLIDYSVMPNYEKTIIPYVCHINDKGEKFSHYNILKQASHTYVEAKKNLLDNGSYNWILSFDINKDIYKLKLDTTNNSFFNLANSEIKDMSIIKENLTKDMRKLGSNKVYENKELCLINGINSQWSTSYLFEYDNDVKPFTSLDENRYNFGSYHTLTDNSKTYLEVFITGIGDEVNNYTILKKNKDSDLTDNSWSNILEYGSIRDFYNFLGLMETKDISSSFNITNKDYFSELGTISHIYQNNYIGHPELNTEVYLIDYKNIPNFYKTIKPYAVSLNKIVEKIDNYDIEKLDGHMYVEAIKEDENWKAIFNIEDKFYEIGITPSLFPLLGNGYIKDMSSIEELITKEMKNKGDLQAVYNNSINVLVMDNSSKWETSFLYEFNKNPRPDISFNNKAHQWSNGNYPNCSYNDKKTFIEVSLKGESNNITSSSFKIRDNSISSYDMCWVDFQ